MDAIKVERKAAVTEPGKNFLIAYLLWILNTFGFIGFHDLYLRKPKIFLCKLVILILTIPSLFVFPEPVNYWISGGGIVTLVVWWLLDSYFIYVTIISINRKAGVSNTPFQLDVKTQSDSETAIDKLDESEKLENLDKLFALHEKGVLTKEEYQKKKSALL